MKAKDRYSAEGLMALRQRVMTGPNAEAVKRKHENAKKIAAITRRLKQSTAAPTGGDNWGIDYERFYALYALYSPLFTADFNHMQL